LQLLQKMIRWVVNFKMHDSGINLLQTVTHLSIPGYGHLVIVFHLPLTYLSQNVSKNVGVGTFTVTLFVSDTFGCVDTAMKTLTSRVPPVANAGVDKTICLGDSGTITASGGVSYQWVPNYNISSPNTATTKVWPTVDTAYQVYVSDAFNCSSLDTINISVSNITALFYADSVCLNNPMHFIDSSTSVHANYASSTWNFNDPPAAGVGKYPTHVFTSDGSFNVTLTSTNTAGCKDDTTMSVAVISLPVVNFGPQAFVLETRHCL
jgi:hypothetical protein